MKRVLLASGLLALGLSGAFAADMPVKAIPYAPPPAPYNWTGFYIGGHFGGGISRNEWESPSGLGIDNFSLGGADGSDALFGGFSNAFNGVGSGGLGSHNATGALGGVQAGYNWQSGRFLFGIEGGYSFADLRGDHQNSTSLNVFFPTGNNNDGVSVNGDLHERFFTKVTGIADISARLGVVSDFSDRTLFYVKGGAAYARTQYSIASQFSGSGTAVGDFDTTTGSFNGSGSWSGNRNNWGWLAGIGLEYGLFGGWTAKVEYNYMGFGTRTVSLPGSVSANLACGGDCDIPESGSVSAVVSRDVRIKQDIQVIKFGLNYRFDLGKGPVVARY